MLPFQRQPPVTIPLRGNTTKRRNDATTLRVSSEGLVRWRESLDILPRYVRRLVVPSFLSCWPAAGAVDSEGA